MLVGNESKTKRLNKFKNYVEGFMKGKSFKNSDEYVQTVFRKAYN